MFEIIRGGETASGREIEGGTFTGGNDTKRLAGIFKQQPFSIFFQTKQLYADKKNKNRLFLGV